MGRPPKKRPVGRPPKKKPVGRPPKRKERAHPGRDMPWEEAIQRVLADADGVLHYGEIADRIVSQGLRHSVGVTPAATVSVALGNSLRRDDSPYLRVGRGEYTLKATAERNAQVQPEGVKDADQSAETGALRAFGMFWRRDAVSWMGTPKLLGRLGTGATDVNCAGQVGVYLLHDRERVVYVGQATDALYARLKAHTLNRLGGRWDRFSWFGLRSVGDDGELSDREAPWGQSVVIETMEAVLIESLEPPLNRRRGDNLAGIECIQVPDPQIERAMKRAIVQDLLEQTNR